MGRYFALLIALILGSWIAFSDQRTPEPVPASGPVTEFSGDRAFADVTLLAAAPHPVGSAQNQRVRDAIVGRMNDLGLSPQVRPGVGVQASRWSKDLIAAGYVENVIGVLPGRDRTKPALALMAHYDSVPGSPGAADDIMGVAVALETVRAIKARGVPARDVLLVITDGEEAGLLGANHFFRRDPLAGRIGLTLNIEARGSSGRAQMFQTSPNNGELIKLFQQTAQRPSSSSLSVLVYEIMPNDTDLTETLRAGGAGLNYAIIGGQFDYHSATATPANLDRGSLQDMGTQVLAVAGEAAFAATLPGKAPSPVYTNVFGDLVIAYPTWGGWVLLLIVAVMIIVAIRWARHDGVFPATDIARGAGALLFGGLATVAVLQFARLFTGVGFGYLEQRFLLADTQRWEWAIMLVSLGVIMLSAGDMARGRRWMAAIPVAAGLGCSLFNGFDVVGAVSGVLAGLIGLAIYDQPTTRKGAWAGVLIMGWLIAVGMQIFVPGAAYVVAWPLAVGALGAFLTAMSARRGLFSMLILIGLAAVALGWQGGISHLAFQGLDVMAVFSLQMITAGLVLWPLAQPDKGARKGLFVGSALLLGGFALTAFVRSDEPWSPRYPQVSYVAYQMNQDTGRALMFSPPDMATPWSDDVLQVGLNRAALRSHWSWREPMLATPAPAIVEPAPTLGLQRIGDGSIRLIAAAPAGARTMSLQLRSSTPARLVSLNGAPAELGLAPGQWVKIQWAGAAKPIDLGIRPSGPGRLDVRYAATIERWPLTAKPLPRRPADVMAWDNSDSTVLVGARAFTW